MSYHAVILCECCGTSDAASIARPNNAGALRFISATVFHDRKLTSLRHSERVTYRMRSVNRSFMRSSEGLQGPVILHCSRRRSDPIKYPRYSPARIYGLRLDLTAWVCPIAALFGPQSHRGIYRIF